MSTGKRYLFTGGGTGGHVMPNLAIIRELEEQEPDCRVHYVGSRRGPERDLLAKRKIPFTGVFCSPFASPRQPLRFAVFAAHLALGTLQSLLLILRYKPHVVAATGGYASVPAVLAAALTRRRIFLHEQNVHPGRANVLLARFATLIGVSFEETLASFPAEKTVVSGYPVRRRISEADAAQARRNLQIAEGARVAFVVGGSMGARSINRGMVEGLGRLLSNEKIAVIHSTGLAKGPDYDAWQDTNDRLKGIELSEPSRSRYILRRYFDQIEDAYAASDLVVTRAGAGVVMELATMGKPALLIPKSDGADPHQIANALSLKERGVAEVFHEEMYDEPGGSITRVHGDQLARKIDELLADGDRLDRMSRSVRQLVVPDAGPKNASLVRELAREKKKPETRGVQQLTGTLTGADGGVHELLFNVNTVNGSGTADIPLGRRGVKALVRRIGRSREDTEFLVIPRRGTVTIDGQAVLAPTRLSPGQKVEFGDDAFVFNAAIRTVDESQASGGMIGKMLVTGIGTLLSRVFGLAREVTMATAFGAGAVLDVFAASLTASNLLRRIFAENAVDNAFLPTWLTLRRQGRREDAARLFRSVLGWSIVLTGGAVVLGILTVRTWLPWLVPGFAEKGMLEDAISLTRLMLPYLTLITVAAIFSALLKAGNRFAVPAWSSIMFSVGIIVGVALHQGGLGFQGLGIGVLFGGFGQILIQVPSLLSRRFRDRVDVSFAPALDYRSPGMRKMRATAPKIVADVAIAQTAALVGVAIVSTLEVGKLSVLYLALLLVQFPFALVSQSINTVALREFSESLAARDRDACGRLVAQGINWTIFTLLPISVALVVFSGPIVDLLLRYRRFDAQDAHMVAVAMSCYAIGLTGWGLQALTGRFYAARLELGQAVLINLVAVLVNVVLSVSFVLAGLSYAGVALGSTIAYLLNGFYRVRHLNGNLRAEGGGIEWKDIAPSIQRTAAASAAAALVGSLTLRVVSGFSALPSFWSRSIVLCVPVTAALVAFVAVGLAIGSPELRGMLRRFRGALPRPPAQPGPRLELTPYCLRPERLLALAEKHPEEVRAARLQRRVQSFLGSSGWKMRNIGVKLAGILKMVSLRYDLVRLIEDREPAPRLQRLLGGDFANPGFVRRNAIRALTQLEVLDEDVERALVTALADPYYEARAAAALALAFFARELSMSTRDAAVAGLGRLVEDDVFEVVVAAVKGLEATARDDSVLEIFGSLHYHPNWQVRNAVVRAYHEIHRRGVITDGARLLRRLDDVLVTCDAFKPTFELKENLVRARRALETPAEQPVAAEARMAEGEA